jgi:hypothetical protein
MRENRAVQLFAMELIDEQAALEEIDFPNYQIVAERVQKRKADAAQAEAMAKGGVPPMPAPGVGGAGGAPAAGPMGPEARTAARV